MIKNNNNNNSNNNNNNNNNDKKKIIITIIIIVRSKTQLKKLRGQELNAKTSGWQRGPLYPRYQ